MLSLGFKHPLQRRFEMEAQTKDDIRQAVLESYGNVAESGNSCGCDCSCGTSGTDETSLKLGYTTDDVSAVPEGANMGLGCGNPKAIASLKQEETVLDLGSGGGFDCFLAAREVGAKGHVIGVDMTPEMLSKARKNAQTAGSQNVEFRLGEIENLPVADQSVDVIISNCVINLSVEKQNVFHEAFRILKSGGRLAIADIVATAEFPEYIKNDLSKIAGCTAGASSIETLKAMLGNAGFAHIRITPKDNSKEIVHGHWGSDSKIEDYLISAHIEAIKG